jgi:tRNA-specific 2-thiouridylase
MLAEKSVLVGMSGGIDSTAVCHILLSQGYNVKGLTFITCDSGVGAAQSAKELAGRLGIEHHVADVREKFRELVIEPFLESYLAGVTPNPCVNCNPAVKFRLLEEWADKLGCKYIATGHYVKVERQGTESEGYRYYIVTGDDDRKDQSYFLWRLTQTQLSRLLLPLGGMDKGSVIEYLKENGFDALAGGGESMEVCFIPGDYRDFLIENVPDVEKRFSGGMFVDSNGRALGTHKGYPFYTVGQRKGLGLALGYPAYVLKINPAKNTVMIGREEQLLARYMLVEEPLWVGEVPGNLTVRVRYRSRPVSCTAPVAVGDGRWLVKLGSDVSAITPGQSAVFYDGNRVVGGAFIADQRGINQWIVNDEQQ